MGMDLSQQDQPKIKRSFMKTLIYLLNLCELLAVVSAFLNWKKIRNGYWKWFAVYLLIIFVIEMIGKYLKINYPQSGLNYNLYSFISIPLQFLFFYWLFFKQANSKFDRVFPLAATFIYVICFAADTFYLSNIKMWFFSFSYTIGNLLLVILFINYLLKFINSDEILTYRQSMMFWVCIGLAIFYLGAFPFYALRNTLYYQYNNIFVVYNYVQLILDCFMYLVFAIAFIWGKPKLSYS